MNKVVLGFVGGAIAGFLAGYFLDRFLPFRINIVDSVESVDDCDIPSEEVEADSDFKPSQDEPESVNEDEYENVLKPYNDPNKMSNVIEYMASVQHPNENDVAFDDSAPYQISEAQFEQQNVHYTKKQLIYFEPEGVLLDPESEVAATSVLQIIELVGENNLPDGDEPVTYVRNDELFCDFRIDISDMTLVDYEEAYYEEFSVNEEDED